MQNEHADQACSSHGLQKRIKGDDRKGDPCGYAKKTVDAVLRNHGLTDLLDEDVKADHSR